MQVQTFIERLRTLLGEAAVETSEEARRPYHDDYTEIEGRLPDAVVRVSSADQVAPILRLAQELRTPVVPVLAASNVGGLCIPAAGGVMLDLMGLDRILEVNDEDRYMVIEPGVTWQQVRDHLDTHHPGLRFGYSLSPPDTTVLGNCLMDGLSNLSLRWGGMSDWLNGLEVVLPTGETVRTGIWAWGQPPVTTSPMPRLDGLFVSWHGTSGVVVRAALEVQARPALRARAFYFGRDIATTFRFLNSLSRADICDDLAGLTWPLAKMLFGEERPTWKDQAEPAVIVFVDYSADDADLFSAKGRAVERIATRFRSGEEPLEGPIQIEDLLRMEPRFEKFSDWPMRLDFLVDHPGGGMTWVGTYGPTSRWPEAVTACHELMLERGFPPAVVTRSMRGGHYGVLRMLALFDKQDPGDVERVARLNVEVADRAWEYGYVPYKTPRWAVDRYRDQLDPGFADLLVRIKGELDPAGILNPGRWLFDPPG